MVLRYSSTLSVQQEPMMFDFLLKFSEISRISNIFQFFSFRDALALTSLFRKTPVRPTTTFRGPLEIGDLKVSINLNGMSFIFEIIFIFTRFPFGHISARNQHPFQDLAKFLDSLWKTQQIQRRLKLIEQSHTIYTMTMRQRFGGIT